MRLYSSQSDIFLKNSKGFFLITPKNGSEYQKVKKLPEDAEEFGAGSGYDVKIPDDLMEEELPVGKKKMKTRQSPRR